MATNEKRKDAFNTLKKLIREGDTLQFVNSPKTRAYSHRYKVFVLSLYTENGKHVINVWDATRYIAQAFGRRISSDAEMLARGDDPNDFINPLREKLFPQYFDKYAIEREREEKGNSLTIQGMQSTCIRSSVC